MKMNVKALFLALATVLFAVWSCEGQTTVKISENCDTIIIESPALSQNLAECMRGVDSLSGALEEVRAELSTARDEISNLKLDYKSLEMDNARITARQLATSDTLAQVRTENLFLENDNNELSALIDDLKAELESKPDTIIETVYETKYDTIIETKYDTIVEEIVVRDTVEIEATEITIRGKVYPISEITEIVNDKDVDTLTLNTCFDDMGSKLWLHRGSQDVYPHDIFIPFKETSLIPVTFDEELTVFKKIYQRKWRLERTRNHITARTTYKALDEVPFQFYIKDSIVSRTSTSVRLRTFGSENHGIKYYVNDELVFDFSDLTQANAGTTVIDGVTMYRHTYEITGLEPQTTYTVRFEGNSVNGEIAIDEIQITTL